jgi:hypothetical protein
MSVVTNRAVLMAFRRRVLSTITLCLYFILQRCYLRILASNGSISCDWLTGRNVEGVGCGLNAISLGNFIVWLFTQSLYVLRLPVVRDHTQRHTTVHKTPMTKIWTVEETSTCTLHNTRKRMTSMPLAEFKPAVPASQQLQTYVLDRTASGIDLRIFPGRIWKNCNINLIELASSDSDILTRAFLNVSQNIYGIIQTASSNCDNAAL